MRHNHRIKLNIDRGKFKESLGIKDGIDGKTPVAGVDFPIPKDGITPDIKGLAEEASKIVRSALEPLIPKSDTPEGVRNKLEMLKDDDRLDKSHIKGIDDLEKKILKFPTGIISGNQGIQLFVDGGKQGNTKYLELRAGSNISLATDITLGRPRVTITGATPPTSFITAISDTASVDLVVTGTTLTAIVLPAGVDHSLLSNLSFATAGHTGFEPTVTKGNLTAGSTKITIGGTGTGALIGAGASVDVAEANINHNALANLTVGNVHTQYVNAISDTASLDLTLTGQSISGAVLPAGVDHNSLANLTVGDVHTHYALLAGRAGGQTLIGGTGVADILSLQGTTGNGTLTSAAIRALVGNNGATTAYTVLNNGNMGINEVAPDARLEIRQTSTSTVGLIVRGASNTPSANHIEARRFSDTHAFWRIGWATGTGVGNFFLNGHGAFGGTAIAANAIVTIGANITDPTDVNGSFGVNTFRTMVLTATNVRDVAGGRFYLSTSNTSFNNTGNLEGGTFGFQHSGTGTMTNGSGGKFLAYNTTTGTITNAVAGRFTIQNLVAGGTITNAYGVLIETGFNNGTITNQFGLYQEDSLSRNYFAGKLGIGATNANSTLQVSGSVTFAYRAITALRTLDITDYTVDCTANTFTVTLPTAVGITGRIYVIKNSGAGVITIDTTSSQTIDGALTQSLAVQYQSYTVQSTGSAWIIK